MHTVVILTAQLLWFRSWHFDRCAS